ncbi:MAG: hypothetical protein K6G28_01005 [Acholeplasmatales bacterium]|nr:hypothetical protein [Acholeplasmatales bacterium]
MRKRIYLLGIVSVFCLVSCKNISDALKVATPGGAPAFAQSIVMEKTKSNNFANTTILSGADEIKASFLNNSYDLIYAPSNLGASMYNMNANYQLLAGVTFGNLYFASTTNISKVDDLNNKKLVLFGENSINDMVVKKVLSLNNIDCKISYLSDTSATKTSFLANNEDNTIYLIADPIKSACNIALNNKNINSYYLDVQALYKECTGTSGFSQACLFVNKDTYKTRTDDILKYVSLLEESIKGINNLEFANENNKRIKEQGIIDIPDAVFKSAIKGSNISFVSSKDMKDIFENTYKDSLSLIGGKLPDEGFYA